MIHPSSVAVSREHRRAKTDRLDAELLKRGFLGWLRGERGHCTMARIPTIVEEDAPYKSSANFPEPTFIRASHRQEREMPEQKVAVVT